MHPILLSLGAITVYSYGAMLSIAFFLGILLAIRLGEKEGIPSETILDISLWVMVSAIIGARLLYVILFFNEFSSSLLDIIMIQKGGLIFFGGLFGGLLAVLIKARSYKFSLWKLFDIAAPGTALGYSISRIGCFLNGCCYGVETTLPWGVHFPLLSGLRHPTQLYASAAMFMAFLALIFLWRKKRFDGQVFLTGAVLYSVYRFFIEYIRTEPRFFFSLSSAQWISVVIFILFGGTLLWKMQKR
jgi:phosphatidylglycerol:prolipoprotein diacylglycerol transferase